VSDSVMRNDIFSNLRKFSGTSLCVFLTCFTIYTIVAGQFAAQVQRGIFLLCSGVAVYCFNPFNPRWEKGDNLFLKWLGRGIDILFVGMLIYAVIYIVQNYFDIASMRAGWPNKADLVCYSLGTFAVIEGVRRTHGWMMLAVVLTILAYLFGGHHLPGILNHQILSYPEIIEMSFSMNGIFGIALATVANVIAIFIILGSVLLLTGLGDLFIDLSFICTGRFVGGPAQSAIIASTLFGSINGSGPANVMSTGSFTIPLMVRSGYSQTYAGAVSATASCVGQIMPPVMGVGAFLMAEITGVPYSRIIVVALVPALLYSLSLMFNVRFRALRKGILPLEKDQIQKFDIKWLPRIFILLATVSVLLWRIFTGSAPNMAGLQAIAVLLIGSLFVKEMRPDLRKIFAMLVDGGKGLLSLTIVCAAIGIVIGGLGITGLGVRFSQAIISIGSSNLLLALIMAAACCIVVGMGLPTAASYLMVVFIAAPALTKLGISVLNTHMFVFYYAVLSAITPPVALNAYAASGIAKSNPLSIGLESVRLGLVGFVLPFLWIYNPDIILGEADSILKATVNITFCVLFAFFMAAANSGFLKRKLNIIERIIIAIGSILLVFPNMVLRLSGLATIIVMTFIFRKSVAVPKISSRI
jgi:TRAP transporter 4TM/12TM fusion protein